MIAQAHAKTPIRATLLSSVKGLPQLIFVTLYPRRIRAIVIIMYINIFIVVPKMLLNICSK